VALARVRRNEFAALTPVWQDRYTSYVAGIERYLADNPAEVPEWAPPLEPATSARTAPCADLAVAVADAARVISPPAPSSALTPLASNAWALLGSRTHDGASYLLSDPHVPLGSVLSPAVSSPLGAPLPRGFQGVEIQLRTPDRRMTGYAMAGTLLPLLGNSEHCGWAFTTGGPSVSDAYWFPASDDERFVVAHEHIAIAGADNYELVQQSTTVNGRYCPVVASDEQRRYVICTTYVDNTAALDEQLWDMYGARVLG